MSRYILKISGKRLDNFLFTLIRFKVSFRKIKQTKDYLIIELTDEDYAHLLKIKTSYQIEIVKRKGLVAITHFLKNRKLFIFICLLGIIFLKILTTIVFDIKVIDTDAEIRNLIIADLEKLGLKKYGFKVNYREKESIEKKILEMETDKIEWLEIEEKGTSYEIKLIKRIQNDTKEEGTARHIVAKKKGLITRIIAEEGEIVTKKNAYVNEGDILISGLIKNKDHIVSKVEAKGQVFAEIWYKVTLNLPLNYHEEEKTGKKKQVLEFDFLYNSYALDFNKYDHALETETKLWQHPLLPISFNLTTKEEITITNKDFSDYDKYIKPLAYEKLKSYLGEDITIISEKVLKKEQQADKIKVEIFFKVEEDITSYSSLADFNIDEANNSQTKEES